jgi:fructose-1,6-bisphosphatase/inositol monophosphatase family enzyme
MASAQEIQGKYENQPSGYLLGATEFAIANLQGVSVLDITRSSDGTGDIVTEMDRCVHESVIRYFQEIGLAVVILGEEGQHLTTSPRYAVLIDEIEGTQNAINALPHGINMAIAPYQKRLQVKDLEAAVVTNLSDGRIFVGERGKGAYKIVDGKKRELGKKQTDVYECPSANAYTTGLRFGEEIPYSSLDNDPGLQRERQSFIEALFLRRFRNQPRSVDATGTRLVELADSNICAYGDWRNVTKCWDVLPSGLIISEAGFVITDVLGFDLNEAVFYESGNSEFEKDGGLNRKVGKNFIAASSEDHGKLVFGQGICGWRYHPYPYGPSFDQACTWDYLMNTAMRIGVLVSTKQDPVIKYYLDGDLREIKLDDLKSIFRVWEEVVNKKIQYIIDEKQECYQELGSQNTEKIRTEVGKRYCYGHPLMVKLRADPSYLLRLSRPFSSEGRNPINEFLS